MSNTTVYPYGPGGTLPASIPIVNDLTTGGADKALSAEQGVVLGDAMYYNNGQKGFDFGTTEVGLLLQQAVKSAWLTILDPQHQMPQYVYLALLDNRSSGCQITFMSEGVTIFGYSGVKQTGVQEIMLPYGSGLDQYAEMHLVIDFDLLDDVRYYDSYNPLGPTATLAEMNPWRKDTITMRDKSTEILGHLFGRKVVVFGDSLSEFVGEDGLQWTTHLERIAGCEVINVGIGGAEIGQRTTPSMTPSDVDQAYAGLDIVSMVYAACGVMFDETHNYMYVVQGSEAWIEAHPETRDNNAEIIARFAAIDWSTVDDVIIFAGTNDWNNSPGRFGQSGSSDPETTLGGINECIRCLRSTYKYLRVFFVSPPVRWLGYDEDPTDVSNFSDYVVHSGRTLQQYVADMKTEINLRHVEFCDLYTNLGWDQYNFSEYFVWYDGTHPRKGFAEIARKVATFISNT